jgi:cytochrome b
VRGEGVRAPSEWVDAWDLPTRLFHWTLVLAMLSAWLSYR